MRKCSCQNAIGSQFRAPKHSYRKTLKHSPKRGLQTKSKYNKHPH